jgi:hypothetical protein
MNQYNNGLSASERCKTLCNPIRQVQVQHAWTHTYMQLNVVAHMQVPADQCERQQSCDGPQWQHA